MKVEPELSDLKQIDGDVYTVNNLIDQHRNCQKSDCFDDFDTQGT